MNEYSAEEIRKHVGDTIKKQMEVNKLSMAALGNMLGVSSQSVYRYVTYVAIPSPDVMMKFCDLFNISLNEFYGVKNVSNDNELLRKIEDIPNLKEDLEYMLETKKAPSVDELKLLEAIKRNPEIMDFFQKAFDKK